MLKSSRLFIALLITAAAPGAAKASWLEWFFPPIKFLQADQLPTETVDLQCDYEALQQTIRARQKETRSSDYQTILSAGPRRDSDEYSRLMANKAIRTHLVAGQESIVFVSRNFTRIAVLDLDSPTTANRYLRGMGACTREIGHSCMPVLYYDGDKAHCLLFTAKDMGG